MCPLELTLVLGMTKPFYSSLPHLLARSFLQPGWWTLPRSSSYLQSFCLARHMQRCQCLHLPFWIAQCRYWLPLREQQNSHLATHERMSTTLWTSYPWNCHKFQGLQRFLKAWALAGHHQADLTMMALREPLPDFGLLHSVYWLLDLIQLQAKCSLCWPHPTDLYYFQDKAGALKRQPCHICNCGQSCCEGRRASLPSCDGGTTSCHPSYHHPSCVEPFLSHGVVEAQGWVAWWRHQHGIIIVVIPIMVWW